jgi:hypothetical protein
VTIQGKIQARFDSNNSEQAVKEVLRKRGLYEDTLMKSSADSIYKVCVVSSIGVKSVILTMGSFMCATSKEAGETACPATYQSPRGSDDLLNSIKVWEAYRATSATSSFFDPIAIGRYGEEFMDGGTGATNSV